MTTVCRVVPATTSTTASPPAGVWESSAFVNARPVWGPGAGRRRRREPWSAAGTAPHVRNGRRPCSGRRCAAVVAHLGYGDHHRGVGVPSGSRPYGQSLSSTRLVPKSLRTYVAVVGGLPVGGHGTLPVPGLRPHRPRDSHPFSLANRRLKTIINSRTGLMERPVPREWHAGVREAARRKGSVERRDRALGRLHHRRFSHVTSTSP